jgi:AraC family transcriptional regulator, regulatory protein of adaptative response / methylated-DNA-[protein]-cysteine methyltransferase
MGNSTALQQDHLPFSNDHQRWTAVTARDPAADGVFYYSVKTTGVYCRPSCPARPARRENVAFHATPGDAESAGFRPCRRCRPDASTALRQIPACVKA